MTDRELIRKFHAGSEEALSLIIEKYYDDIYRFCRYLTGNQEDSYDLSQEVFLRFIQYSGGYRHKNLKGYLLIIARNLCRDYLRKKEAGKPEELPDDLREEAGRLTDAEEKMAIDGYLKRLPFEQREVVLLRIWKELRFGEIAEMLGLNLSTVKSRYRLGIERLRKEMKEYEKRG